MTPHSGTSADSAHGMADSGIVQPEQLFRAIFEQAAVGVALIETSTGRFVRINQRYCEIVGLSRGDMTATTFMAITHPDDLQIDLSNMEELKAGRIPSFSMEKRYVRSDGSTVWVDLTVSPMWKCGEQPTFHIAVVQDITDRKRAEQNLADLNAMLEQEVSQRTKELRDSRHQLQAIIEGTSDAVYLKDAQGRYLIFNEAAGHFVGKHSEEALGKDDTFLFPPAEAQVLMEQDRRTMFGGKTLTYEETVTTADGVTRTFQSTKGPMFDAQGHVAGLFGISRDITERKRAHQMLSESEVRLNLAVHLAKIGIFDHDHRTETLYWSPRMREIYGVSTDEPASLDGYIRSLHPDDRNAIVAAVRQAHDPAGDGSFKVDHRLLRPDGTVRWVSLQSRTYFEGEGSTRLPVRTMGVMVDMTEREQAEAALRESEERFRSIFEHAGTGITILDLEGQFLQANPSYCRLVGYTEAELRTLDCKQVVHPEDLPGILAQRDRLYAQEVPFFEVEGRHRHKDGHDVWVHKFVSLLRDEAGQPRHLFALVTDVTERRQAHALLEHRVAERTEALLVSEHFTKEVLDSLSARVAVLDASGVIVAVNRVWEKAAQLNDPSGLAQVSLGANYVKVCESAANESSGARRALKGIIDVLAGRKQVFESEYLCVWPGHKQWFSMRVTPLGGRDGGAVVAHEDITARKRAEEAVRESYHRLQTVSREVQVAEERERSRLSRELHDEFGQLLGVLKFTLSTTEEGLRKKAVKTGSFAKPLKGAMETVDQLFVSIRSIVAALRPPVLEQLGLSVALRMLASDVIAPLGVRCRVIVRRRGLPKVLPVAVEGALYRTAQELLTNVVRHAKATHATITLSCTDRVVKLVVQDNGRGFTVKKPAPHNEFGLQGIRERAELLGGAVAIDSRPSMTAVTVSLPLGIPSGGHHTTGASPNPRQATQRRRGRNDHT